MWHYVHELNVSVAGERKMTSFLNVIKRCQLFTAAAFASVGGNNYCLKHNVEILQQYSLLMVYHSLI